MTNLFTEIKSKINKSAHFMLFLSFINCWPYACIATFKTEKTKNTDYKMF